MGASLFGLTPLPRVAVDQFPPLQSGMIFLATREASSLLNMPKERKNKGEANDEKAHKY